MRLERVEGLDLAQVKGVQLLWQETAHRPLRPRVAGLCPGEPLGRHRLGGWYPQACLAPRPRGHPLLEGIKCQLHCTSYDAFHSLWVKITGWYLACGYLYVFWILAFGLMLPRASHRDRGKWTHSSYNKIEDSSLLAFIWMWCLKTTVSLNEVLI